MITLHTLVWPKLWANGAIYFKGVNHEGVLPNNSMGAGHGHGPGYGATYVYHFGDGIMYGNQEGDGHGAGIDTNQWKR